MMRRRLQRWRSTRNKGPRFTKFGCIVSRTAGFAVVTVLIVNPALGAGPFDVPVR